MTNLPQKPHGQAGFTLIELSIVLVIIGLIVGGVLVGQDLISAAETRAQISQIEKINTGVNTFRVKYNAIPGDISNPATFGFVSTGRTGTNQSDGDGLVESFITALGACGETLFFWQDLGTAGLIDGSFSSTVAAAAGHCNASGAMTVANHLPAGKLGGYVGIYTTGGANYYEVSGASGIAETTGVVTTTALMKIMQAYNIDSKMDDGTGSTGTVVATEAGVYNDTSFTAGVCLSSGAYIISTAADQASVECNLRFAAQF